MQLSNGDIEDEDSPRRRSEGDLYTSRGLFWALYGHNINLMQVSAVAMSHCVGEQDHFGNDPLLNEL